VTWDNLAGVYLRAIAVLCCLALMMLVVPAARADAEEAAVYKITITYNVQNVGANTALGVKAVVSLFDNATDFADQQVLSETISVDGDQVYPTILKGAENRYTEITLGGMASGASKWIWVTQTLKVKSLKPSITPSSVAPIPSELLVYTQPVANLWQSDDSRIFTLADNLAQNATNLYYKALQIFSYIAENITYQKQTVTHSALQTLLNGNGDCDDLSNLFIAMVRAENIPAKVVTGYAYLTSYAGTQADLVSDMGHAWSLIYLPGSGWVPADETMPESVGTFGEADYSHIAGEARGGEGVVSGGQIIWKGPGQISESWGQYHGEATTINAAVTGTVTPQALLEVKVDHSSTISNDTLPFTVTVTNMGQSQASNLSVGLDLDSSFDAVTPQSNSSLAGGEQWVATFDVHLKEGAYGENHAVLAEVTYTSAYAGLTGELVNVGNATVPILPKQTAPVEVQDLMILVLIGVVLGAVVGIAAFVARR